MVDEDRKPILTQLAERLAAAWKTSSIITSIAQDDLPSNRSEAYFIQDAMADRIGEPTIGWKIGASSAKMRELQGQDDIIPGRLFPSTTHFATTRTLPLISCANPRVETEFALRLDADMPMRREPWTAAEVEEIATLHLGLEIIGNRVLMNDIPVPSRFLMGIADNGTGVAGLFGPALEDWRSIDLASHPISFVVDDDTPSENFFGEMRCRPAQAVADLANLLQGRELSLKAGDLLLTGTATKPLPVEVGSRLIADYGPLGRFEISFA